MSGSEPPKDIKDALSALFLQGNSSRPKDSYAFWGTQPVAQFNETDAAENVSLLLYTPNQELRILKKIIIC